MADVMQEKYTEAEAKKVLKTLLGLPHLRSGDVVHVNLNPQKILFNSHGLSFRISNMCDRPAPSAPYAPSSPSSPSSPSAPSAPSGQDSASDILAGQAFYDARELNLAHVNWEQKRRIAGALVTDKMESAERGRKAAVDAGDVSYDCSKCTDGIAHYQCRTVDEHKFCPECLRQQICPACKAKDYPCGECLKKEIFCLVEQCRGVLFMFEEFNSDISEGSEVRSTPTTPCSSSSSVLTSTPSPIPAPSALICALTSPISAPAPAPAPAAASFFASFASSAPFALTPQTEQDNVPSVIPPTINELDEMMGDIQIVSTRGIKTRPLNSLIGDKTWVAGNSRLERNLFSDKMPVPNEQELLSIESKGPGCSVEEKNAARTGEVVL